MSNSLEENYSHQKYMISKILYKVPPEAMMRLVQAGMTILDLDNAVKKNNPLEGMSTRGKNELAQAIVEGNLYLSSVQEILGELTEKEASEALETDPVIMT